MLAYPRTTKRQAFPPCPLQNGRHCWVLSAANYCHRVGLSEIEAERLISAAITRPPNPPNEIQTAIQKAYASTWHCGGRFTPPSLTPPKWPALNQARRAEVIREGYTLADLREVSNPRLDDNRAHTEEIVDRLFPPDALICCGKSSSVFDTKPREQWRGELAQLQFIVPSPMTARTGLTKDGKESAHALSNTGARRFLVCEFDSGSLDEQAGVILHLAQFAPMVCALHSGGKSLHSWFFVANQPEEKISRFFKYAVFLGADSRLWTRSQFCRMPDGERENGRRQAVYFLNFKALEAAQ